MGLETTDSAGSESDRREQPAGRDSGRDRIITEASANREEREGDAGDQGTGPGI